MRVKKRGPVRGRDKRKRKENCGKEEAAKGGTDADADGVCAMECCAPSKRANHLWSEPPQRLISDAILFMAQAASLLVSKGALEPQTLMFTNEGECQRFTGNHDEGMELHSPDALPPHALRVVTFYTDNGFGANSPPHELLQMMWRSSFSDPYQDLPEWAGRQLTVLLTTREPYCTLQVSLPFERQGEENEVVRRADLANVLWKPPGGMKARSFDGLPVPLLGRRNSQQGV